MIYDGDLYVGGSEVLLVDCFSHACSYLGYLHALSKQSAKQTKECIYVYKRGVCGISNPKDLYVS